MKLSNTPIVSEWLNSLKKQREKEKLIGRVNIPFLDEEEQKAARKTVLKNTVLA